jgi:hypothetical protein
MLLTSTLGCDAIKSDLSTYSKTAVPVYNSYSEKYAAKMEEASKTSSPEEFLVKNKEGIAILDEFRAKMGEFKPETKEVQDLNQNCIAALTSMEDGAKQLGEAIEKHDADLSKSAQAKIEDAGKADDKFRADLKALEEKHHVEVK